MPDGSHVKFDSMLGVVAPRAGHFIVSLYGDVVEPRGGTLWMGRVIELCQAAGLSETLVRTAVSRLVAAGQLVGERVGRRSYYRLTPKAQIEFAQAAQILFSPPATAKDFALLEMPVTGLPHGFAAIRPDLALGAFRADLVGSGQAGAGRFLLRASVENDGAGLQNLVASLWDLEPLAERYRAVLSRFAPLLGPQTVLAPQDALIARLLLVDDYRLASLRDPMLPRAALPQDWPGWPARALFVRLYLQLSMVADSYIQHDFAENEGMSSEESPQLALRKSQLLAETVGQDD